MLYRSRPAPRKGLVLVAVLVVLVLLTLAAYQFAELMSAEYRAAESHTRSLQARTCAESGIHYAAALLADPQNLASSGSGDHVALFSYFALDVAKRLKTQA